MPVDLTIDVPFAHFVCYGVLTFDEIMEANGRLLGSPEADDIIGQLVDSRAVTERRLSREQHYLLSRIDSSAAQYLKPNRVALVVADPKAIADLGNYVQGLADTAWEAAIFPEPGLAWAWLRDEVTELQRALGT